MLVIATLMSCKYPLKAVAASNLCPYQLLILWLQRPRGEHQTMPRANIRGNSACYMGAETREILENENRSPVS